MSINTPTTAGEEAKVERSQTSALESTITELQTKNILFEQQVKERDTDITHHLATNEVYSN